MDYTRLSDANIITQKYMDSILIDSSVLHFTLAN